jgi:MoxR-like ATPase
MPDDVHDVAVDVIAHRLVPSFDAIADGVSPESIVEQLLRAVPFPQVAPAQYHEQGVR